MKEFLKEFLLTKFIKPFQLKFYKVKDQNFSRFIKKMFENCLLELPTFFFHITSGKVNNFNLFN